MAMDLASKLDAVRNRFPGKSVLAGNVRWQYLDTGSGEEVLLLLPGFFVGRESWYPAVHELADDLRILAPDYAPVGTWSETVSGLEKILQAAGVRQVHLVGQSIGGLYAQMLVAPWASQLASVTLSHASLPQISDLPRVRRGVLLGTLAPQWVHRRSWKKRMAQERPPDVPHSEFWKQFLEDRAGSVTKRELVNWGRCYGDVLRCWSETPPSRTPGSPPMMILEGANDPLVSASQRQELRDHYAGALCHAFPATGHWSPEVEPERFAGKIRDFVAAVRNGEA